jgi:hypothetical protein
MLDNIGITMGFVKAISGCIVDVIITEPTTCNNYLSSFSLTNFYMSNRAWFVWHVKKLIEVLS